MRLRRASTLALSFESGQVAVHNFLTQDRFTCSPECLDFLASLEQWHTAEELCRYFPGVAAADLDGQVTQLVDFHALVVDGTALAERDEAYRRSWEWGTAAGSYHFGTRDTRYLTGPAARRLMRARKARRPSPPLFETNAGRDPVVRLPATDLREPPFALMRARRSERRFTDSPLSLTALADCLFAGNGIVEIRDEEDFGSLPITMTPSGGARNPFELYVYANRVEGLEPGFYHYGARDHDLGRVRGGRVDVPEMLGGQKWPGRAAAIVFLVAHFPRSMWKYHLAMAYRVVLMEAGFIGQNIALAATHHGLSAVPSGALNETLVETCLGTPPVEAAVVLSLSLGRATANGVPSPFSPRGRPAVP